ncbi:MAG: hypothetical protein K0R50_4272 [Eubacterium sp.]|nr:hypothetical protein [Eubacterium sp.]
MYFAIIGDIKNSRKINDRYQVQEQLEQVLKEINEEFDNDIAAKFLVTLGDEFQGLLKSAGPVVRIIEKMMLRMHPVKIRFGVGFGDISTKINPEMAIGADGTAYHHARKMINEIKKMEKSRMSDHTSAMLSAEGDKSIVELINNTFYLWSFIQDKWTTKQVRLILETIICENNQREVAGRLGIVQSTVQRGLKSSGYYTYFHTRKALEDVFVRVWG